MFNNSSNPHVVPLIDSSGLVKVKEKNVSSKRFWVYGFPNTSC